MLMVYITEKLKLATHQNLSQNKVFKNLWEN